MVEMWWQLGGGVVPAAFRREKREKGVRGMRANPPQGWIAALVEVGPVRWWFFDCSVGAQSA